MGSVQGWILEWLNLGMVGGGMILLYLGSGLKKIKLRKLQKIAEFSKQGSHNKRKYGGISSSLGRNSWKRKYYNIIVMGGRVKESRSTQCGHVTKESIKSWKQKEQAQEVKRQRKIHTRTAQCFRGCFKVCFWSYFTICEEAGKEY